MEHRTFRCEVAHASRRPALVFTLLESYLVNIVEHSLLFTLVDILLTAANIRGSVYFFCFAEVGRPQNLFNLLQKATRLEVRLHRLSHEWITPSEHSACTASGRQPCQRHRGTVQWSRDPKPAFPGCSAHHLLGR